jgi:hypothetical protein
MIRRSHLRRPIRSASGIPFTSDVAGVATAAKLALMNAGGDLHESGVFTIPPSWTSVSTPGDAFAFMSADTPDGLIRLSYNWPTYSVTLRVRGVDVLSGGSVVQQAGNWHTGDKVQWRCWYKVSTGECGFAIRVNGCWGLVYTAATTGTALAAPTAAWIGSSQGTSLTFAGTHANWTSYPSSTPNFRPSVTGYIMGDSREANYVDQPAVGNILVAGTDNRALQDLCATQAVGGDTITSQIARLASATVNVNAVTWVVLETAVNDILEGGHTAAQTLTSKAAEVAACQAKFPNLARVYVPWIPPCKQSALDHYTANPGLYPWAADGNALYQAILDYNAGLSGVAGVDVVVTAHYAPLCTTLVNFLNAGYDEFPPEGLHENYDGRVIKASAVYNAVHADGYI